MTIYLIRHGETAANKRRVLQMPDSPLSDNGIQQAKQLSERLKSANIVNILCSDYPRAQQTAAEINIHHKLHVSYEPLLRERNFGDWRGMEYDAVAKDRLNSDLSPPNGEDTDAFFTRITQTWNFIQQHAAKDDGITVVISHGLTCRALVQNHVELPQDVALPERWSNTSVTRIDYREKTKTWMATTINCVHHLRAYT